MIESWLKNPLSLKRYRHFKKTRRSVIAAFVFGFLFLISLTAELWSNSKPVMMRYQGKYYFPAVKYYHPDVFAQTETMVTDYRAIAISNDDFSIWPLVRWDPYESDKSLDSYPAPPSATHLLGTDDTGRDVFSRLIYGFRYTIWYALAVWFFSFVVGTIFGAIMGFWGGKVDLIGQRLLEIFESTPTLLLLITIISFVGSSINVLIVFSVAFGWMGISVYMRSEFLRLRRRDFVEAARAAGATSQRIIFKHILPNALTPIFTFSPIVITAGISSLAVLDFLGFGLPPPTPSWGELLKQAQNNFTTAWWLATYPSVALFVTLVSLNLVGEGLRDAYDPKK